MGQPLAIARADLVADDAAVHVTEVDVETGVPLPLPLDVVALQIGNFLDRAAKAGRANHRAIRARQAALGDFVPARMFQVRQQQIADAVGIEPARDLIDGLLPGCLGGLQLLPRY